MSEFKLLFPVTYGIPDKPSGLITYHICGDGIYLTKKVMGKGYVTIKVEGMSGCPKGEEAFKLLPRKIPVSFYWKICEFFRAVEKTFNQGSLEAYILVGYNPTEDKYFLHVPDQEVSAASVKYDIKEFWDEYPGCFIICDVHSHNHMGEQN